MRDLIASASALEAQARKIDEARRVRLIERGDVDIDLYLRAGEAHRKVREAGYYLDEMRREMQDPEARKVEHTMGWKKTEGSFRFRPGEVTLYAGASGGGKSLLTGQICLSLIRQGEKVCVQSFEMKPKRTLSRMIRQFLGEDLEALRLTCAQELIKRKMDRFESFAGGHLWLYDQQGTVSTQEVIAVARFCALELGIGHIFIDSLMKCVAGEDDYNAQKNFIDELTSLARDHMVHIHLIHHIRKLQAEEVTPSKFDIKGSGSIGDQVDNILLVWRNKRKEHDRQKNEVADERTPDTMLMCEKQRNGESEDWFGLWFDKGSQQFVEMEGAKMVFDSGDFF